MKTQVPTYLDICLMVLKHMEEYMFINHPSDKDNIIFTSDSLLDTAKIKIVDLIQSGTAYTYWLGLQMKNTDDKSFNHQTGYYILEYESNSTIGDGDDFIHKHSIPKLIRNMLIEVFHDNSDNEIFEAEINDN